MKNRHFLAVTVIICITGSFCASAYGQKKVKVTTVKPAPVKKTKKGDPDASAEPDKVLYDRALLDIKKSRYTEGRLALQTLINTYPDSEYLAKAKLGVADSFYKESGTSNLTQAIEEYKNFIVFFPFLDEAAYAQMQVGMAHYRMMEKADRDTSQAQAAEDEFQAFLLKYPQNPLVPQAVQNLRDVQEILADGGFKIARFYYLKQDFRASAARLIELTGRYPLYSQSDEALSMLGDIYLRAKQASKNEDDQNHWADLSAKCYSRILEYYPLSPLAPQAKAHLLALGMPIPITNHDALARMQQEQIYGKQHRPNMFVRLPMGMIKTAPDVYTAAHVGQPNMNPPDATVSATDVLNQGAAGPSFTLTAKPVGTGDTGDSSSGPIVDSGVSSGTAPGAASSSLGVEIIEAPTSGSGTGVGESSSSSSSSSSSQATVPLESAPANAATSSTDSQSGTSSATTSDQSSAQQGTTRSDSQGESTSKKKKGLHKIIPF